MVKLSDIAGAAVSVAILYGVATSAADVVSYTPAPDTSAQVKQCLDLTGKWFTDLTINDPTDSPLAAQYRLDRLTEMQRACLTLK